VFAARRDAFMKALGPNAVAVVRSLPERLRNGDAFHPFRQHSDILYLTGFAEPHTTLVFRPGAETERFVMFVRPRDAEMEVWDGKRAGLEGAKQIYGADAAYNANELRTRLWELIANHEELHYGLGIDEDMTARRFRDPHLAAWKEGKRPPGAVTIRGAARAALAQRPELAAPAPARSPPITRRRDGCRFARHVRARDRADRLHVPQARRRGWLRRSVPASDDPTHREPLRDRRRHLVLVDAGCEYDHYTADITRTWPATGKFTPPQRDVYELVLATQQSAIDLVKPGATLDEIHDHCVRTLTAGMISLGLLAGSVDERIADLSYRKFYMHGTSHWLGLDVHDVGAYTRDGKARPLAPGMVITVEPGFYVAPLGGHLDDFELPLALRGIGVRIEDDVLVTETGREV
jgi:Xaa-Pro aminopeptidase